jgi:hypothetical protein
MNTGCSLSMTTAAKSQTEIQNMGQLHKHRAKSLSVVYMTGKT